MTVPGIPTHTYVMYRCNRWGTYTKWLRRAGIVNVTPKSVVSWWGKIVLDGNVANTSIGARDVCPVNATEAIETGRCVMALPEHLMLTMVEEHCEIGTQEDKAAALDIDARAFRYRKDAAYALLLELFNLAAAGLPLIVEYQAPGRPKGVTA